MEQAYEETQTKQRLIRQFSYAAKSWNPTEASKGHRMEPRQRPRIAALSGSQSISPGFAGGYLPRISLAQCENPTTATCYMESK